MLNKKGIIYNEIKRDESKSWMEQAAELFGIIAVLGLLVFILHNIF